MKTTITALLLCALSAVVSAQTVTVADVEALPGETVAFTLDLTGGKANTYIALQFDVQFPATGFTTTGDYSVSPLWKNASSVVGTVDASGVATIPVSSAEFISASNVEGLLTVYFKVGSDVALDEYEVTLKNIWLGYGTSSKDYLDDVTFKVNVTNRLTFNETSATLPQYTAGTSYDIRMVRSIKAGEWSTLVLPFNLTKTIAQNIFGSNYEMAKFSGFEVDYGDDEENVTPLGITINFTKYTVPARGSMAGGTLVLVKTDQDIDEPIVLDGVTLTEGVTNVTVEDEYGTKGVFTGSLVKTTVPADGLFISDNKFWYSTGKTNIKAFRGWFELGAVLNKETEFNVKMSFNVDGISTRIPELEQTDDSVVYDLGGRKVVKPQQRGIYITNGRKVAVK